MPLFAIHCIDRTGAQELRQDTRPEHLDYLESVKSSLFAAGPLLDGDGGAVGSLIIIDCPAREDALNFAANDPYSKAGLFQSVAVTPWRQVYPKA